MSFRKRNVVLSVSSTTANPSRQQPDASASPAARPGQQQQSPSPLPQRHGPLPSRNLLQRPSSMRPSPQDVLPRPQLPDPTWPLAARPELSPQEQARLEPGKQRLRALLEQEKQRRHQRVPAAPLGPGARPSPFDGRPITSTGTASLDPLLAGYGGLVLGHSLLVEEQGTTDFAIALLRAYAAEGLVQGHHVHVAGFGPGWQSELPGLASSSSPSTSAHQKASADPGDKMKIAWRYEALAGRPSPNRPSRGPSQNPAAAAAFCHSFDLTKRLAAADIKGVLHPFPLPNPLQSWPEPEDVHSPLKAFLAAVQAALDTTPPSTIHRVVLPSFLAPTLYAADGWSAPYVVALMLGLRGMLREHGRRLSVMMSLSTTLYERSEFHVRQIEKLCDNVVELIPLPPGRPSAASSHSSTSGAGSTSSRSRSRNDSDKTPADKMQGWFKFHKLQIYSEMGGAGASPQGTALRENYCFSLSGSRGMIISPYSLPPVDDDSHKDPPPAGAAKESLEF